MLQYQALDYMLKAHYGYDIQTILICHVGSNQRRKTALLIAGSATFTFLSFALSLLHMCVAFLETPIVEESIGLGKSSLPVFEGSFAASFALLPPHLWFIISVVRAALVAMEALDHTFTTYARGWRDLNRRGCKVKGMVVLQGVLWVTMALDVAVHIVAGYHSRRDTTMLLFPATVLLRGAMLASKSEGVLHGLRCLLAVVRLGSNALLVALAMIVVVALWSMVLVPSSDGFASALDNVVVLLFMKAPHAAATNASSSGLQGSNDNDALVFQTAFGITIGLSGLFLATAYLAASMDIVGRLGRQRAVDAKRRQRLGAIAAFIMLDDNRSGAVNIKSIRFFSDTGLRFKMTALVYDPHYDNKAGTRHQAPADELNLSEWVEVRGLRGREGRGRDLLQLYTVKCIVFVVYSGVLILRLWIKRKETYRVECTTYK